MKILEEVTVIICVRNAADTIEKTIISVMENNPKKIIIVDGNSSDKTIEICKKYPLEILHDQGIGLGNARNIGLSKVKTEYTYYVGPDCIIPKESIEKLITNMENNSWVGTQPMVSIYNPNNYFLKSINLYRKAKFYPGKRNIIGTPWMYKTSILLKYKFNDRMNYSDDTELCSRLEDDKLSIGITDVQTYEIGEDNIKDLSFRWKMYGNSDHDFYQHKKLSWNFVRKISSYLSPLKKDFLYILISSKISFWQKLYILYFLFFITITRYYGWYLASLKLKREYVK